MVLVVSGLLLVNGIANTGKTKETSSKNVFILLGACVLHSIAAIIDKKVLTYATGAQMQFWFLLFVAILCWLILLIRENKLNFSKLKNNYWAMGAGVCLLVQDKFLFAANEMPARQVSIMTLIKQLSAIEAIIFGKIFFKEKKITKKILCGILIIAGIAIAIL